MVRIWASFSLRVVASWATVSTPCSRACELGAGVVDGGVAGELGFAALSDGVIEDDGCLGGDPGGDGLGFVDGFGCGSPPRPGSRGRGLALSLTEALALIVEAALGAAALARGASRSGLRGRRPLARPRREDGASPRLPAAQALRELDQPAELVGRGVGRPRSGAGRGPAPAPARARASRRFDLGLQRLRSRAASGASSSRAASRSMRNPSASARTMSISVSRFAASARACPCSARSASASARAASAAARSPSASARIAADFGSRGVLRLGVGSLGVRSGGARSRPVRIRGPAGRSRGRRSRCSASWSGGDELGLGVASSSACAWVSASSTLERAPSRSVAAAPSWARRLASSASCCSVSAVRRVTSLSAPARGGSAGPSPLRWRERSQHRARRPCGSCRPGRCRARCVSWSISVRCFAELVDRGVA